MIDQIKVLLRGWDIPVPPDDALMQKIDNEQRFIEQHNQDYDDHLDKENPEIVATVIAYHMWVVKSTYASTTKGGVSISNRKEALLDNQIEESYMHFFSRRFSRKYVSVV